MNILKKHMNKIELLRKEIINQLITSDWEPENNSKSNNKFSNKYFTFSRDFNTGIWSIGINHNYKTIPVSDIMPVIYFHILRFIYVRRSLNKYRKSNS